MTQVFKALSLLLLLLAAQQGAVVHELSHLTAANRASVSADADVTDAACSLCPAYAQVTTPAFSHSFHIPLLGRCAAERQSLPPHTAIDAAVPRPRSRGPPVLS